MRIHLLVGWLSCALALGCGVVEIRIKPGVTREDDESEAPAPSPSPRPSPSPSPQPANQSGRYGDAYLLGAKWRPLERIVERGVIPGLSNTATTTVSPKVYVVDLDDWLKKNPPGGPMFEAILLHEQLHAIRQERRGVDAWVKQYMTDRDFMWAEEQLGWNEQIKALRGRGLRISAEGVAQNLSRYRNLTGSMVSYEEALKWVHDVLAGRWRPPK